MSARSVGILVRLVVLAGCAAPCALLACGAPEPTAPPSAPEPPAPVARPAAPPPGAPELPAAGPPPAPAPPAEPSLSLEELGQRIKQTPAIGTFSKLSLKNDLDDLVDGLRAYHEHKEGNLGDLHQRYEALVLKILVLLEPDEPELAQALGRSRERVWKRLVDPVEFAKLTQ
jgi:hypothetical protein